MRPDGDLTDALRRWDGGDERGLGDLLPAVQAEVRRALARLLRRDSDLRAVQPAALVHAACLPLVDARRVTWHQRAQFLSVAARVARRVLVAHARRRAALKRAAAGRPLHIDSGAVSSGNTPALDLVALDDALGRLALLDRRQARVVELRYFGGLLIEEAADVLQVSAAIVRQDWESARLWLYAELRGVSSPSQAGDRSCDTP
jgi:RNA polymerase sigma factor (TIGR02999 family)